MNLPFIFYILVLISCLKNEEIKMAIKPKRAVRPTHMKRKETLETPSRTKAQIFGAFLTKSGLIVLAGFFLTFIVFAVMLVIGFFADTSKDMFAVLTRAILKFQSIRAGIFTSGILLLGIVLIGAIMHKARWMWSGVLIVTLIFVTCISAYVDFILYGQTSSAYVPNEILDALYEESTPYRKRQMKHKVPNQTYFYLKMRTVQPAE